MEMGCRKVRATRLISKTARLGGERWGGGMGDGSGRNGGIGMVADGKYVRSQWEISRKGTGRGKMGGRGGLIPASWDKT